MVSAITALQAAVSRLEQLHTQENANAEEHLAAVPDAGKRPLPPSVPAHVPKHPTGAHAALRLVSLPRCRPALASHTTPSPTNLLGPLSRSNGLSHRKSKPFFLLPYVPSVSVVTTLEDATAVCIRPHATSITGRGTLADTHSPVSPRMTNRILLWNTLPLLKMLGWMRARTTGTNIPSDGAPWSTSLQGAHPSRSLRPKRLLFSVLHVLHSCGFRFCCGTLRYSGSNRRDSPAFFIDTGCDHGVSAQSVWKGLRTWNAGLPETLEPLEPQESCVGLSTAAKGP